MTFDPSVNLGNLLTVLSGAIAGIWFLSSLRTDIQILVTRLTQFDAELKNFDNRLGKIAESMDKITDVLVRLSRQEERMDAMDIRINEFAQRTGTHAIAIDERIRRLEAMAHEKSEEPKPSPVVVPMPARKKPRRG